MIKMLSIIVFAGFFSSSSYAVTMLDGNVALSSSVTFEGNMSVSAKAGKYMTNAGDQIATTDKQLEKENARANKYAGASEMIADYAIQEKKDGKFKQGSITLDSNYSISTAGTSPKADEDMTIFTTDKIKIIAARISGGKIESFKFRAKNWYPETEAGGHSIIDKGIKGKINFLDGTIEVVAAYKLERDAVLDKFKFTGDIPHSITAVPETSTWAMMLVGFVGLGFTGYRASRKRKTFAA